MAYSSDGITWSTKTTDFFERKDSISAIAYGGGKFVAVGNNGKMAYSSDDKYWIEITNTKFDTDSINAIAYGSDKFVAVGNNGKMAYSEDGINWTAVTTTSIFIDSSPNPSPVNINTIAYGSNKFVAVGNYGKMAHTN